MCADVGDAMTPSPPAVRIFILLVTGAALALGAIAIAGLTPDPYRPVPHPAPLAAAFVVAIVLAGRFPIQVTFRTRVYVDTTVLTAAAILFDVPWAMAVAAVGVAVHQVILRDSWEEGLFNTAQTALYVGAGAAAYHALARAPLPPSLPGLGSVAAPLGCVVVMYVLNTLMVATIAALQVGSDPLRTWLGGLGLDLPEHAALVAFAVLGALVARDEPWALPMFVAPIAIVYLSLRRSQQMEETAYGALEFLATVVDLREPAHPGHSDRVAALARRVGERLGLPAEEAERIAAAARVHDVGKAGVVPDSPKSTGAGTVARNGAAQRHPALGAELVGQFPRYSLVARDVRHHHERWDGGGYPDGLAGDAIPVGARIIAVADAFDQLAVPDSNPIPSTEAMLRQLRAGADSRWDPRVVDALVDVVSEADSQ
jgi:HD-GYP domain-containing protein (c-di-GMP phosphodiesterase class II)